MQCIIYQFNLGALEDCLFPFRGTTRTGRTNYIQFNSRPCTVISNPISKDDMFDFLMELEYTRRSNRIQMRSPPTIYDSPKNAQRIKIPK